MGQEKVKKPPFHQGAANLRQAQVPPMHNQVQGVPLTYTISIVFSVVECPPTADLSRPRFINVSRFFGLNIVSNFAKMRSSIERDFQSIHRKKSKIAKWRPTNPLPTTLQPNAKLSIDLEILQD